MPGFWALPLLACTHRPQDRKASGVADDLAALYNPLNCRGSRGLLIWEHLLVSGGGSEEIRSPKKRTASFDGCRGASRGIPTEIHLFVPGVTGAIR